MATYYASSNNQRDAAPMIYMPGSYSETPVLPGNMMMYMNGGSYSDTLAGNTQQQNNCIQIQSVEALDSTARQQEILSNLGGSRSGEHDFNAWRDNRNEMLVMNSMGGPSGILHSGQNLHGQGLSLSLGTQIPSGIQMPSIPYRNPNPGLASFLGPNPSIMGEGGGRNGSSRDEQSKNAEYLPPGFPGGNQDSNKGDLSPYGMTSIARTIPNSKYLKAAQQLLDEVVNVRKALKQPDKEKNQSTNEHGLNSSKRGLASNLNSCIEEGYREEPIGEEEHAISKLEEKDQVLSAINQDGKIRQLIHNLEITYQIIGFALFGKNFGKDKETVGRKVTCMYYASCFEFDLRGSDFELGSSHVIS
ncbi:hypothetical protein GH714_031434 [Hevea brasiliensis]|uniref:POX domain-containing protein n=1 Tax=Hevea brasiliensis TaxID=3981 RepID=A0A6A6NDQ8_HEVBR|nr:hypothetical protein GH714_031434 [Hevea brasiliensis]